MLVLPDDMVGKPVGFTCSTFDLLHAGHILMLAEAKTICDHLIVGLQTDPTIDRSTKNKPVQSIVERYVQLSAVKFVDEIIVYETEQDLLNMMMTHDIDVRFLGEEYKNKDFTGKQWCLDHGMELHYHEREHPYSSSSLRYRTYLAEQERIDGVYKSQPGYIDKGNSGQPVTGSITKKVGGRKQK